jgi:hypothetical protein
MNTIHCFTALIQLFKGKEFLDCLRKGARSFVHAIFLGYPVLVWSGTNDGTLLLLNDSAYILTATIQAADGSFLGQYTIQPGQQRNVTQNLFTTPYKRPGSPDISLTPYTVIWQCSSSEPYSMCTDASPGALVRATVCPGVRACRPRKEPAAQETPASSLKKTK